MPVKNLTETGVERVKVPPGKRLDLHDAIVQGLCLRISANNVKSWYFMYRMNGSRQRRMMFGRYPEISLKQAREIAREHKYEIAQNKDPFLLREQRLREQERAAQETVTVEQLAKECLERHWKPNTKQWKPIEALLKKHIYPEIGKMAAKDVTRKDIYRILDRLSKSKRPSKANLALASLRKLFNWGIERDILTSNPCHTIKNPVKIVSRERYLEQDEIRPFWQACEKLGLPYGSLFQLLLLTGQRRSEIANLRWHDIDFDNKLIRLSADRVKNKKAHEVPLSDFALSILESIPRHRGSYIFSTTGGKKPVDGFGKTKAKLDEYFKTSDWRIHDLRRSAATGMAMLGVHRDDIKRILNHSDGTVTAVYDRHSYMPEKRKALDLWAQHIQSLLTGEDYESNIIQLRGKRDNPHI